MCVTSWKRKTKVYSSYCSENGNKLRARIRLIINVNSEIQFHPVYLGHTDKAMIDLLDMAHLFSDYLSSAAEDIQFVGQNIVHMQFADYLTYLCRVSLFWTPCDHTEMLSVIW